ncbi:unnamed protein product [Arctogadus glacialis]
MQFFEALDLVHAEIERRFDQSGMTTAALREATLLSATNGMVGTEEDLVSLKLPGNIDVPGLHMQLRMLVGLTRQEKFGTLYDLATFMSSLHAQTRDLAAQHRRTEKTHSPGPSTYAPGYSGYTGRPCSDDGIHQHHPRTKDHLWSPTIYLSSLNGQEEDGL